MNKNNDEKFMTLAIEAARKGIAKGQTPFGACVVKNGEVITATHNHVWMTTDITAHAEVHAIREACRVLKSVGLDDCTIYSTTEPCPMCFSAIHWAKISRIVYGASITDAHAAGFNELHISNDMMKKEGKSPVKVTAGVLREECVALFGEWKSGGQAKVY